ncbi:MAG: hypothetical protein RIG82_02480 [Phycisphaeraceae bacterium]
MIKSKRRYLGLLLGFGLAFPVAGALTGCNMMEGAGEDMEETGDNIEDAADDAADEVKDAVREVKREIQ